MSLQTGWRATAVAAGASSLVAVGETGRGVAVAVGSRTSSGVAVPIKIATGGRSTTGNCCKKRRSIWASINPSSTAKITAAVIRRLVRHVCITGCSFIAHFAHYDLATGPRLHRLWQTAG
jgi:hypothetical protein